MAIAAATLAILILCAIVNRSQWRRTYSLAHRMSVEARAFVDLGSAEMLRNPAIPPAAMVELQWVKTAILHRNNDASWTYDDIYFCSHSAPRRVIEFEGRTMADVTAMTSIDGPKYCGNLRNDAPLEARFRYRDQSLFWDLGPYRTGHYRFVLADGLQAFEMPQHDGFQLGTLPGVALRIRYASPEGWIAYSPLITIDLSRNRDLSWSRNGRS